jgi:hypothetical protein
MTLTAREAEEILRAHLGKPAKTTKYVIGFMTPSLEVLAMHRTIKTRRIWFEPPAPDPIVGLVLLDTPHNRNSNLNRDLLPLRDPSTLRAEINSAGALGEFLTWYITRRITRGT